MEAQFILGLLVAIPLSILANLATPRVERWWSQRSDARAARADARSAKEQAEAEMFYEHPAYLTLVMQREILAAVVISSLITLLALAIVIVVLLPPDMTVMPDWVRALFAFATEGAVLVFLTIVTRRTGRFLRMSRRVRKIHEANVTAEDRAMQVDTL